MAGDGSNTARTEASDVGLGFDDFEISSEALKLFTAVACMLVSGMSTAAGEGSKIRSRAPDKGRSRRRDAAAEEDKGITGDV